MSYRKEHLELLRDVFVEDGDWEEVSRIQYEIDSLQKPEPAIVDKDPVWLECLLAHSTLQGLIDTNKILVREFGKCVTCDKIRICHDLPILLECFVQINELFDTNFGGFR